MILSFSPANLAKIFIVFFTLCAILITTGTPAHAKRKKPNNKYASIVMDADTGIILHQRNANKSLHPASLTKIMTLLMLFEEMKRGKVRLNDRIYISKHAASMIPSKLGLEPGSSIRVRDAINALAIKSANDIAVAVAEHIGGTEEVFARLMTRRAHEIGMSRTYFKNASGLNDKYQISTAHDMAKLANFVIHNYPNEYKYYSHPSFTYKGVKHRTHNKLMKSYPGMDGMKTGYIAASGFNLVASAVRDNHRLIGVVFGGRSSKSRNAHMRKLLDNGFKRVTHIMVASHTAPKPPHKPNLLLAMQALNNMTAAAAGIRSANDDTNENWASTSSRAMQEGAFAKLIGEGDSDPASSSRIETGLLAISAHQKKHRPYHAQKSAPQRAGFKMASYAPAHRPQTNRNWTIQLGAYKSRAQVEHILRAQTKLLPPNLQGGNAHIAPLKTRNGWLFRGRIGGYQKNAALQACKLLKDCVTIPPK